jgi:uncharacterized protein with ParB-like and HNH nuclease domain
VPDEIADGALLELKLIGDIAGSFRVARYQRGYRWGELEVKCLLTDIWESKGEPYTSGKSMADSRWRRSNTYGRKPSSPHKI